MSADEGSPPFVRIAALAERVPEAQIESSSRRLLEGRPRSAVATAIGLRAPIAQGLMSLSWMMEALARNGAPAELDILTEFRHPIFWEDRITVLARGEAAYQVRNAEARVCSIGRVRHLARD